MADRKVASSLGRYVYGAAAIALGVTGLVWGDFATNWQRVQADVPGRHALAYITAVYELFGGVAILWRRTARAGAMMLAILYSFFALLWVPRILGSPQVYDVWGNFFEELSLVIAGVVLWYRHRYFFPARPRGYPLGSSGWTCLALAHRDDCWLRSSGVGAQTLGLAP
jgi:uncharacterized membrane protein YphA (DoxX/SURF4 family)